MNIVVKSALAGMAVIVAHACATPVEIADDVLPAEFGDGGPPLAGAGGGGGAGGQGGTGSTSGSGGVAMGGAGVGGTGAGPGGSSAGSGT